MVEAIRTNGITPVGDDQQWKSEEGRFDAEVAAKLVSLESKIEALQGRVN